MKNLREEMKQELKSRLSNYREEPEEGIWEQIAPHIVAKRSASGLWRRIERSSLVLLVIALLSIPYSEYKNNSEERSGREDKKFLVPAQKKTAGDFSDSTTGNRAKEIIKNARQSSQIVKTPKSADARTESSSNVLSTDKNELEPPPSFPPADSVSGKTQDVRSAVFTMDETIRMSGVPKLDDPKLNSSVNDHMIQKSEEISYNTEKSTTQGSNEKSRKKFTTYFTAMPTFGYQRIKSNDQDNIIIQSIKRIPTLSTSRLGIRGEIGIESRSDKRTRVFGGLLYYQRRQTIGYIEKIVDSTNFNTGSAGIELEPHFTQVDKSFEYELKNIGLQVGINYMLSRGKFLQTIGTGIEFQVALNKLHNESEAAKFTTMPSAYVFYNIYYRIQYPADSRLKAIFQPTLNYGFYINENLNAPFYVQPYGLGLNIGATYQF